MREFTRVLEAGQQDKIATSGDYVYFKSGTGEIKIITDDGHAVILQVGHGIRFDKKFKTVDAQNTNNEKATFVLMIGSGDFQNNRMVGVIEVEGGLSVNNIVKTESQGVTKVAEQGIVRVVEQNQGFLTSISTLNYNISGNHLSTNIVKINPLGKSVDSKITIKNNTRLKNNLGDWHYIYITLYVRYGDLANEQSHGLAYGESMEIKIKHKNTISLRAYAGMYGSEVPPISISVSHYGEYYD